MKNEKRAAQRSAKEVYIEAYKLGIEYREKVYNLFDSSFGNLLDLMDKGEAPSIRQIEGEVFDKKLDNVLEYLREKTFEAVEDEYYEVLNNQ